jgi:D-arabinose 1-dehydrogenase-like Zn-dependent alcohol dehydrogenase
METPLNEIAQRVAEGTLKIPIKTFRLDQIVEAHVAMDESTAGAKIVVLV